MKEGRTEGKGRENGKGEGEKGRKERREGSKEGTYSGFFFTCDDEVTVAGLPSLTSFVVTGKKTKDGRERKEEVNRNEWG
jgi:hypothetical protein